MPAPSAAEFRETIALLPTGVTIVTAVGPEGPAGATANAVTSLSLAPPLMLASLDRGSRTLARVLESGRFGVSVLGAGQADLARGFASKASHADKWREVGFDDRDGVPVLHGAVAWIACELRQTHDGGDHAILVGAVIGIGGEGGDPLVFHRGAYRALGS